MKDSFRFISVSWGALPTSEYPCPEENRIEVQEVTCMEALLTSRSILMVVNQPTP